MPFPKFSKKWLVALVVFLMVSLGVSLYLVAIKRSAEAYRYLGALTFTDNIQASLNAYRRATELDNNNAENWNMLGQLLMTVNEFDTAIASFSNVLTLAQNQQNQKGIAVAYWNLGVAYRTHSELDKAKEFQQKALQIGGFIKKEQKPEEFAFLDKPFITENDMNKVLDYQKKSFQLNEAIGNIQGMADAYSILGIIKKHNNNEEDAVEFHQKSLQMNESLGNKERILLDYNNLGNSYEPNFKAVLFFMGFGRGNLEKAIEMYQKSLSIAEALEKKESMKISYGNLWYLYKAKNDQSEAEHYFLLYENSGGIVKKGVPLVICNKLPLEVYAETCMK